MPSAEGYEEDLPPMSSGVDPSVDSGKVSLRLDHAVGMLDDMPDSAAFIDERRVVFAVGKRAGIIDVDSKITRWLETVGTSSSTSKGVTTHSISVQLCAVRLCPKHRYVVLAELIQAYKEKKNGRGAGDSGGSSSSLSLGDSVLKGSTGALLEAQGSGQLDVSGREDYFLLSFFDLGNLATQFELKSPLLPVKRLIQRGHKDTSVRGPLSSIAFSSDSKFLVTLSSPSDNLLCIWEWGRSRLVCAHLLNTKIQRVTFNPKDKTQIATSGPQSLQLWRVAESSLRPFPPFRRLRSGDSYTDQKWTRDGVMVALTEGGDAVLMQGSDLLQRFEKVLGNDTPENLVPTDQELIIFGATGTIAILRKEKNVEPISYKVVNTLALNHRARIYSATICPRQETLLLLFKGQAGVVLLSALNSIPPGDKDKPLAFLSPLDPWHQAPVSCLSVSTCKSLLATCTSRDDDTTVRVWNYRKRRLISASVFKSRLPGVSDPFGLKKGLEGADRKGERSSSRREQDNNGGPSIRRIPLSVSFHPDGYKLLIGFADGLRLYHVLAGSTLKSQAQAWSSTDIEASTLSHPAITLEEDEQGETEGIGAGQYGEGGPYADGKATARDKEGLSLAFEVSNNSVHYVSFSPGGSLFVTLETAPSSLSAASSGLDSPKKAEGHPTRAFIYSFFGAGCGSSPRRMMELVGHRSALCCLCWRGMDQGVVGADRAGRMYDWRIASGLDGHGTDASTQGEAPGREEDDTLWALESDKGESSVCSKSSVPKVRHSQETYEKNLLFSSLQAASDSVLAAGEKIQPILANYGHRPGTGPSSPTAGSLGPSSPTGQRRRQSLIPVSEGRSSSLLLSWTKNLAQRSGLFVVPGPPLSSSITRILVSDQQHQTLFAATNAGSVLLFDYPLKIDTKLELTLDGVIKLHPRQQIMLHSLPITALSLSGDGSFLLSTGEDGAIFCCEIVRRREKERHSGIQRQTDREERKERLQRLAQAEEDRLCLINSESFSSERGQLAQLAQELAELRSLREYELQSLVQSHRLEKAEMEVSFLEQIKEKDFQISVLEENQKRFKAKAAEDLQRMEASRHEMIGEMEKRFDAEKTRIAHDLKRERERADDILVLSQEKEEALVLARKEEEEKHKKEVQQLKHLTVLERESLEAYVLDMKRAADKASEQEEEEANVVIARLKAEILQQKEESHKKFLHQEYENTLLQDAVRVIKGELKIKEDELKRAAMSKEAAEAQRRGLEEQLNLIREEMQALERKDELLREHVWQEKQSRERLEKERNILNHKLDDIQGTIAPRDEKIKDMLHTFQAMDEEWIKVSHTLQAKDSAQNKKEAQVRELQSRVRELEESLLQREALLDRFRLDLDDVVHEPDQRHWKTSILELHRKYTDAKTNARFSAMKREEVSRANELLRSTSCLRDMLSVQDRAFTKAKGVLEHKTHTSTLENMALLEQLNALNKDNQTLNQRVKALQKTNEEHLQPGVRRASALEGKRPKTAGATPGSRVARSSSLFTPPPSNAPSNGEANVSLASAAGPVGGPQSEEPKVPPEVTSSQSSTSDKPQWTYLTQQDSKTPRTISSTRTLSRPKSAAAMRNRMASSPAVVAPVSASPTHGKLNASTSKVGMRLRSSLMRRVQVEAAKDEPGSTDKEQAPDPEVHQPLEAAQ